MPRRHNRGAKPGTKLARARLASELTQADMIEATGIKRSTYWRLERGRIANPPLRHLTNCAIVLGVPVDELIEEEWKTTWLQLGAAAPAEPPDPEELRQRSLRRAQWRSL